MGLAIKTAEQGCAWTTMELMLVSPEFAHTVCLWLLDAEPIHSIQIQILTRSLDGQAEFSPLMAGGAGTISALAPGDPSCNRTPPSLALVMRFLPDGVNRLINVRDRAEVARVFVALLNHWVSTAGGEGALTDLGTTRQLTSAEKSAKIIDYRMKMKSSPQSLPKFSTSLCPPLVLDQVRTVLPYLSPPQLECAQLWIDEARILQDSSFTLVTLVDRIWGLTNEEVAFARLRIYGPFPVEPVVSGSHRALQRLVTPDILAGLLALSDSQWRRVGRRLRPSSDVWDVTGQYPYSTADRLWSAAMRMERRWWRSLWPGRSHERPVTLNQVIGVFPRLEPDAVDQVAPFLERRTWRGGRASATLEDVMFHLQREKRVSDADMHYARKRLGLEQEITESLQPH
ncbi:hypothetical protein BJX68DRAFT_274280 [Aspergillus pseudodeflectus]|uniref:Uncharacterized protein n=1 Tax=Aspergillus pseudodeflectus TaxID=176178 RepID=A0ABR4JAF6_9EURO